MSKSYPENENPSTLSATTDEESPENDGAQPEESLPAQGSEPAGAQMECRAGSVSLHEQIRIRKRSVMRQIEYHRLQRIRKRTVPAYIHCKNCGEKLQGMYCHRCGQFALDIQQPFWKYIRQYFENVYQFDSKIWQTLYLLFRRPGFLTQEFNAGKINSYVHPFRLYMCISVVFFTILFMLASSRLKTVTGAAPFNMPDTVLAQLQRPGVQRDTVVFLYNVRGLKRALKEEDLNTDDLLRVIPLDEKRRLARVELPRLLLDSCLFTTTLREDDRAWIKQFQSETFLRNVGKAAFDREELAVIEAMKEFRIGETKVYDWQKMRDESERLRVEFYSNTLMAQISKWTPFFMLFMLPIFALLTRWVYRKNRMRYMQHFVHAIHINTVFLLLLTVPMSIHVAASMLGERNDSTITWSFSLFYAFILGYMLVSFHRVYGLGWVRTAFKTLEVFCAFTLLAAGTAAAALLWLIVHLADSL